MNTNDISGHIYNWTEINDFTFDDFICLNGSLSTKIFSTVNNIYKKSQTINFYSDFYLYEVIQDYWPYPIRLFYNKDKGISFHLNGSNEIIYNLNKRSRLFEVKRKLEKENIDNVCIRYIRMFFDNVEGQHGMFHIFESFHELEYVVNLFYQLEPEKVTEYSSRSDKALIKKLIRDSIFKYSLLKNKGYNIKLIQNKTTEQVFERTYAAYMLFKGDIFYANITIKTNPEENAWGEISLSDEVQPLRYNESGKIVHELQVWEQDFESFGFGEYLPPIHLMQINDF